MDYCNRLTDGRKNFLERLNTLIFNEFERQKNERIAEEGKATEEKRSKEETLENNIKTFSIDAGWGEGKSFFSKALIEKLENNSIETFKFNAWKSDYSKDALKSFFGELVLQLKEKGLPTSELEDKMLKVLKNSSKILGKIIAKKIGITDDELGNLQEMFSGVSETFFKDYLEYKEGIDAFKTSFEGITKSNPKVIIIDELDRCKPTYAIELLEAVKHLFDVEGLIFIFMVNKSQLEESVKNMYGEVNKGEGYFKKFFDLEFLLPSLNLEEFSKIEYKEKDIKKVSEEGSEVYNKLDIVSNHIFIKILKELKGEDITAREVHLMYKKYQQLLMTLVEEEKRNIPFLVTLALYFIYREKNNDVTFEEWCLKKIGDIKEIGTSDWDRADLKDYFEPLVKKVITFICNIRNQKFKIISSPCNKLGGNRDLGNCLKCDDMNQRCNQLGREHKNWEIGGGFYKPFFQDLKFNTSIRDQEIIYYMRMPIKPQYLDETKKVIADSFKDIFEEIYSLVVTA